MADAGGQGADSGGAGPAPAGRRAVPGGRPALVYGLITFALLVALFSTLTLWVQRQVLDTDRWTDTSAELMRDADVREAVSIRLVDAVFDDPTVVERIQDRLPPALDPLAPSIAAGLRTIALDRADTFLQRPRVLALWEEVNRRAHRRLVDLLRGNDEGLVTSSGGDVVLDLSPLVTRLRSELGIEGEPRLGGGEIVLMSSDQLAAAQDAVSVLDVLSPLFAFLVIALIVLAVYLADGFRREAVRAIAAGLVVVGLVLLVVRRLVGEAVVDSLAAAPSRDAANTVWIVGTSVLGDIAVNLVAAGVIGLLWVFLSGPTRWARWTRAHMAPVMRDRVVEVYAVVVVLILLKLWWIPTDAPRRVIGTLALIALVIAGVEALRRQVAREYPGPAAAPAPLEPAGPPR